ncbi:MAG TPA: glutamate--tRNA ligase [Candidatus Methanofastidiosa archaeon]|nr:glutamate--tRNA ligase [Candidatus Methanofastidiosa archaeon]
MAMEEEIREYALKNAVSHGGEAQQKAVISKLLGQNPELRKNAKDIIPTVIRIINEVNSLGPEEQRRLVEDMDPEFFVSEKKEKRGLPPLPDAEMGKVTTRLPPEPNGYPHIGHGLSFYFNYYYARKYDGTVILRFDDTNPKAEKTEYYDAIKKDLKWLGLSWEREHNMSDDMEKYYAYAEGLIKKGKAYICGCDPEKVSKLRFNKQTCECQHKTVEENLEEWREMPDLGEGSRVLRLRGNVASQNTAMRDPTLFRVIRHAHPIQGDRYTVWPVYDFACSIEDSILGITHVLRSNEFTLRIELQDYIRNVLCLRCPITIQYSRFTIRGSPTSKRLIRPLIEEKVVKGWDDPRLVTLRGLERRGIVPQTVYELAKEMGLSTAEPEIDWSLIESINRKLIDPVAKRFFFAEAPVPVKIDGFGGREVSLRMHPDEDLGERRMRVTDKVFIPGNDAAQLAVGETLRLKDLCNIRVKELSGGAIEAEAAPDDMDLRSLKKVQWVPEENVVVNVIVPSSLYVGDDINEDSLRETGGLGESSIGGLALGEIVQFERFGFVRVDSKDDGKVTVVLAHK